MEVNDIVPQAEDIDQGTAIIAAILEVIHRVWQKRTDLYALTDGDTGPPGRGRTRRTRAVRAVLALAVVGYVALRVDTRTAEPEPEGPITLTVQDLFPHGSEALSPVAEVRLEEILEAVGVDRDGPHVDIIGSCDDTTTAEACLAQAEARARAVATWLAQQGVPARRLSVTGAGTLEPMLDELGPPDAAERVELRLDRPGSAAAGPDPDVNA